MYNFHMDIFVNRLNKLLKENNITKYRLAKELGVSKQAVLWWCDGINEPKISYLQKLAIFFDVSADYLLGLEDETGAKTYIVGSFNNFNNSGTFKI